MEQHNKSSYSKTRHRLLAVLVFVAGIVLFGLWFNYYTFVNRQDAYRSEQEAQVNFNIGVATKVKSDFLRQFLSDYSYWTELADGIELQDSVFLYENLGAPVENNSLNYAWAYLLDGNRVCVFKDSIYPDIEHPIKPTLLYQMFDTAANQPKRKTFFYDNYNGQIINVAGSTVHSTDDIHLTQKPRALLFMADVLDSTYLRTLSELTNTQVTLHIAADSLTIPNEPFTIHIPVPLRNWHNETVATLLFKRYDTFQAEESRVKKMSLAVMSIVLIITLVGVYIVIISWIYRPLQAISLSLRYDNPERLTQLSTKNNEFGNIAQMVRNFFEQRQLLITEIEERRVLLEQLTDANKQISKKNKDLTDSINYAKRIQNVLLPHSQTLQQLLPRHFIFYQPRDIVSGDFYWTTQIENKIIIAVADCTGHGVPGALMSMLGISLLNDIVTKKHLTTPNLILDHLRHELKTLLRQTADDESIQNRDGMDIAICTINTNNRQIEYAGALVGLWYMHNERINIIEPTRNPVGVYRNEVPFENHILSYTPDQIFYLFSDGICDQVGGVSSKKYSKLRLKNFLEDIADEPIEKQEDIIKKDFINWKGKHSQVDDMMMLAFQISTT